MNELVAAPSRPVIVDPARRAGFERLETEMLKMPQIDCPLKHYFVEGLYHREIFIPAGTLFVGFIHRFPCITTLSKGRVLIADGDGSRELVAPFTFTAPPGSKKAGYAITDVIWADTYLNLDNEVDLTKLKARYTAASHDEFLARLEEKQ